MKNQAVSDNKRARSGKSIANRVFTIDLNVPGQLLRNARELRRNQTSAEERLWELVRARRCHGLKFRRQHPVVPGYILDFFCAEIRLGIEVDGSIHEEERQKLADQQRTEFLRELNICILRFSNSDVLRHAESVVQRIRDYHDGLH